MTEDYEELVDRYRRIPDCGPCEDENHADCLRPAGIQCCCSDHPLVGIVDELLGLIADFVDREICWYDHHGYCQAHGWFETDPACPHARAKKLLAREF